MLAVERRQAMYEKLQKTESVTVSEMSLAFSVSEETIRRDLTQMEKEGLLQKTYGGAFLKRGMHLTVPVSIRERTCVDGKDVIGGFAADLVESGDTIFLDVSTTALRIAEKILGKKNLIVITNSLRVAETLSKAPGIKVICAGGTLRSVTLSTVGKAAENSIAGYFADKAFICCDGVHRVHGITDANEKEAEVRKRMMRQADRSILVADATKFDKTSFVHMADFSDFHMMLTDRNLSDEWRALLGDQDVDFRCGDAASGS